MNRDIDKIFAQAPKFFPNNKSLIQYMRKSKCFTRKEIETFTLLQDNQKDEMRGYINEHPSVNSLKQLKDTLSQWRLLAEIQMMGMKKGKDDKVE